MNHQDLLVGAIAVIIGIILLAAGLFPINWFLNLPKLHWIERRWGRASARAVLVLVGIGLLVLGIAVAGGWQSWTT